MKYVVLSVKSKSDNGIEREIPIIFPNILVHEDVYNHIQILLDLSKNDIKPVSAGEYCPMRGICYGDSFTLKLSSREDKDTNLIKMIDYTGGAV